MQSCHKRRPDSQSDRPGWRHRVIACRRMRSSGGVCWDGSFWANPIVRRVAILDRSGRRFVAKAIVTRATDEKQKRSSGDVWPHARAASLLLSESDSVRQRRWPRHRGCFAPVPAVWTTAPRLLLFCLQPAGNLANDGADRPVGGAGVLHCRQLTGSGGRVGRRDSWRSNSESNRRRCSDFCLRRFLCWRPASGPPRRLVLARVGARQFDAALDPLHRGELFTRRDRAAMPIRRSTQGPPGHRRWGQARSQRSEPGG
jgi:hypothetical protein